MNFFKYSLFGFALTVLLSSCIPEQRIIWSPDGRQAVVLGRENGQQTLYLFDSNGSLSPKLFSNVHRVIWRPDSRGLVWVRSQLVESWTDVEPYLAKEEKAEVIITANAILEDYAQTGNFERLDKLIETDNYKNVIKLYFKHHHTKLFDEQKSKDGNESYKTHLFIIQTVTVQDQTIQPEKVIAGSTMTIWGLRVSPQDLAVAYTCGEVEDSTSPPPSLYVASLNEKSSLKRIAENVALFSDWSSDGQYLVYAVGNRKNYGDELQLGAIARNQVADDSGQILPEIMDREELAGIIMNQLIRVRCAPDGGIVFSAFEINLPATANDMPEHMTLFKLQPSKHPIVSRLVPRNIESYFSGEMSSLFEFSPDYKRIAFVDTDNKVAILTLVTGELQHAKSEETENLPSWRSANELCYVHTPGKAETPEVALYSLDRDIDSLVISTNWPVELLKSFDD